jgi:hypothetical protein
MSNVRSRGKKRVTLATLAKKVDQIAAQVEQLEKLQRVSPTWWRDHAGRFANDPVFDEIVRLGREERRRERPRDSKRARS